jgi:hypothetical protein
MKKSILFILSILFISTFVNAQIKIMPYAQMCFSDLNIQENGYPYGQIVNETPRLGASAGFLLSFNITDWLEIGTGFRYQDIGTNLTMTYYYSAAHSGVTRLNGVGDINLTIDEISYPFISIPFHAQFNLPKINNITPYVVIGADIAAAFKMDVNIEGYFRGEYIGETTMERIVPNPVIGRGNIGIGIKKKMSERFIFNAFVMGDFTIADLDVIETSSFFYKPYSVNLGLGLSYIIIKNNF